MDETKEELKRQNREANASGSGDDASYAGEEHKGKTERSNKIGESIADVQSRAERDYKALWKKRNAESLQLTALKHDLKHETTADALCMGSEEEAQAQKDWDQKLKEMTLFNSGRTEKTRRNHLSKAARGFDEASTALLRLQAEKALIAHDYDHRDLNDEDDDEVISDRIKMFVEQSEQVIKKMCAAQIEAIKARGKRDEGEKARIEEIMQRQNWMLVNLYREQAENPGLSPMYQQKLLQKAFELGYEPEKYVRKKAAVEAGAEAAVEEVSAGEEAVEESKEKVVVVEAPVVKEEEAKSKSKDKDKNTTEPSESKMDIVRGSCTDMHVDVVVNAANKFLAEGAGVCGAIFSKAGSKQLTANCASALRDYLASHPENKTGTVKDGDAVITEAFNMKNAQAIIHAVGPDFRSISLDKGRAALCDAYYNSLVLLMNYGFHSIAFPMISAGIFAGTQMANPVAETTRQCKAAFERFKKDYPDYAVEVKLCAFGDDELMDAVTEFSKE